MTIITGNKCNTGRLAIYLGYAFAALQGLLFTLNAVAQEDRVWEYLGPRVITSGSVLGITDGEVVGAINTVALHPSNADVMFIAEAPGKDDGLTWPG